MAPYHPPSQDSGGDGAARRSPRGWMFRKDSRLFLLLPQHPLQKAGAELPYFGISAHQLGFKKTPTASLVLNLCGVGEGRGIVSIIYTIVTLRQNYRTSSSRGSLPYIHKTSVIMSCDLLFSSFFLFFFFLHVRNL